VSGRGWKPWTPTSVETARGFLDDVVRDLAKAWRNAQRPGSGPTWFESNDELLEAVDAAIVRGDGAAAVLAIRAWRDAWLEHLRQSC